MDDQQKNSIYDRLAAIRVEIEREPVPRPSYLNDKIWECQSHVEEVERFHIELTRAISILQRSLNNSEVEYQTKKDKLISGPEISSLPGARDKEAKANQSLTEEIARIRDYKNDLTDHNNLLKTVDLKLRNLNQITKNIYMQVRILEAQIRLNARPGIDPVTKGLMEEMGKSRMGLDVFGDAETTESVSQVADPAAPITADTLLAQSDSTSMVGFMPEAVANSDTLLARDEDEEEDVLGGGDEWEFSPAHTEEETESTVVNLDQVIEIRVNSPIEGGTQARKPSQDPSINALLEESGPQTESDQHAGGKPQTSPPPTEQPKTSAGIDIDDLLDHINQKA